MEAPQSESALLDFPAWLSKQGDGVRDYLNMVPEGPEREAAGRRLASQYAVAEQTGADLSELDNRWDTYRGGYAALRGGEWAAAANDDNALYDLLKSDAQKQQGTRWALQGLDDSKDPAAASAWENSLVNRAREAAYNGKSAGEAYADWQSENIGSPWYDDTKANQFFDVAKTENERMSSALSKVRPIARAVAQKLTDARDGQLGNGGDIAPFEDLRGLSPEEKRLTFRVIADGVSVDKDKGFWQAGGEALGRGFENLAVGGNLAALQSYLAQKKPFVAGDKVTEDSAAAEVREDFRAQFSDELNPTGQEFTRQTVRAVAGKKLTAEDAQKWNEQVSGLLQDVGTAEELRKFGQEAIDPTDKAGGAFRRYAFLPAMDSAALMASMMIPGAGPAALTLRARSYQGDEFRRLGEIGQMDVKERDARAEVAGYGQALLDEVEFGLLKGFGNRLLPKTTEALGRFALTGNAAGRFALNTLGTAAAETGVEIGQDYIVPALVQDNFQSNPDFDVRWGGLWADAFKASPKIFAGMILLSGVGGAFQVHEQNQRRRFVESLSSSPAAMLFRGYSQEQISEIQAAPGVFERGELLEKYDPLQGAAPDAKRRAEIITKATEAAKIEQAAFNERQRAETTSVAEADDHGIGLRRVGSGWWVTQGEKSIKVDDAEAARIVRDDLATAATDAEAATLIADANAWVNSADAETERSAVFSGDELRQTAEGVTRTRDGVTRDEELSPASLDRLHAQSARLAEMTGNGEINNIINGANRVAFRENVADGARRIVQEITINRTEDAPIFTLLHEKVEAVSRTLLEKAARGEAGGVSIGDMEKAVGALAPGLDPARAKGAEERGLFEQVQKIAAGKAGTEEIQETLSELTVAEVVRRRKDGTPVGASVMDALRAAIDAARDPKEVSTLGKLRATIAALRTYFRGVLRAASALQRAKLEGHTAAFEDLVDKLTGADGQHAHDAGRMADAEAMMRGADPEYVAPSAEDEVAGVAFSLATRRVSPGDYPESLKSVHVLGSKPLTKLAGFDAAKNHGDANAAWDIAKGIVTPEKLAPLREALAGREPIFLPVQGRETEAANALPVAAAYAAQRALGGRVWEGLYKSKGEGHNTGAAQNDRAKRDHIFIGDAPPAGSAVVIVDDTFTTGNTVVALIDSLPEMPVAVLTMARSRYGVALAPTAEQKQRALDKMGISEEGFRREFGFDINRATGAELHAYFLNGGRGVEGFRTRFFEEGIRPDSQAAKGIGKSGEIAFSISRSKKEQLSAADAAERITEYDREKPGTWPEDLQEHNGEPVEKPLRDDPTTWRFALTPEETDLAENGHEDGQPAPKDQVLEFYGRAWEKFGELQNAAAARVDEATKQLFDLGWRKKGAEWIEPSVGFRLSAGNRLEAMQRRLDASLARDPERRRQIGRRAVEKLQTLQFNAETLRKTGLGDDIKPIAEKRTAEELNKEQAMRQALRTDELLSQGMATLTPATAQALDNGYQRFAEGFLGSTLLSEVGRLMSKTEAARLGLDNAQEYDGAPWLPAPLWGGNMRPDEAAQILADMGVIKDAYPDTLWKALDDEMKSIAAHNGAFDKASKAVREIEKQARNQAREEVYEWRRGEDERQAKDWAPRAALLRDLRALDAILSVLPPELRGKVGGFVKLASLGSDQARLKEIEKRIEKLSGLLEKHLKKESTEGLDALLEKAVPDREGGKQSRGKLGAEGHRYFDALAAVRDLTPEQVDAQRAAIDAEYGAPGLTNEQAADLFERAQVLDTFGAWKEKNAAEMDAALLKAEAVYRDARNVWRMKEEARLEEVRGLAENLVKSLGGADDAAIQANKAKSATALGKLKGLGLDLKSFTEVMDALLGEEHPLAKRWSRMAREGLAVKNDELRAFRHRWKSAMEAGTGERGVKAQRILWEMGQTQSVTIDKEGVAKPSTVSVPISVIDSWANGGDPAALGISSADAAQLSSERKAMAEDDRRKYLELHREAKEAGGPISMTEAEGIFLTMLGAQEQYAEGLRRAGYDEKTLAAIDKALSEPAKALREFMRGEYRDGYAPLASIFERMFGVALPQIANYAPAAFYHEGMERAMDPTGGGTVEGGFRSGFLKNRKTHVAAPKLENAFATFFGHANQTAHWKSMAEFMREFSGVMGKTEVKRAIESAHGAEMLKAVSDWGRALEGNGLQAESGEIDKWVRKVTSAQVHIALTWNIGTMLKQATAVLGSAYTMPLGEYARGFAKLVSGQLDAGAMFKSDVIQRRLESGFAPEVRAAMNDVWNAKPTLGRALVERGTEFIGLVDAFFTTGSAAIAYDYHHRAALEAGMTGALAHETAMREVEDIVSRTAQPAEVADRSLYELRNSGAVGKLLFMFASEARQKTSLVTKAWANTLTGKATAADVRVLVISHLIVGPMIQAITAAWRDARDDDDGELFDSEHWKPLDFLKAIVAGPLAGLPLIGDVLSGFRNDGVLGRFVHAFGSLGQILSGPSEHEDETAEWYAKRIAQVMQGTSAEIGVAGRVAGQVFSVLDNFLPDSESEAVKKQRREAAKK